ncbi:hypothetical protein TSOC_006755 [Tetrabaena socialis]|uniref:Uncharacterized protein n=1 Tax=Tetrabaena socialis TaxID=47790 RepID=A0A2J8A2U3_9CHLO|nr:hypothetical protein TSOC_006755 [Tetrabaena socialis]|eukprot:PNH06842.1 hypothetical protein TSOC_006755 [Tetrabaena socialis]
MPLRLRHGIPTAHTVLACSALGPLGLLSHFITKWLCGAVGIKPVNEAVTVKSGYGSITILPYTEGPL